MNISASKISDLDRCTYLFYCKHVLGLPDSTHWKTRVGSALHNVIEYVLKPKRRAILDKILANGFQFAAFPSIDRYCRMWAARYKLDLWDHQNVEEMLQLTFVTLAPYLKEGEFVSEQRFEIDLGDGATASGYVDIAAIGPDKRIIDMKTKGQKFTKKELAANMQAIIYQMWYYETYGELVSTDFILTRFPPTKRQPKNHLQSVLPATPTQIAGLKYYLKELYGVMNSFGIREAHGSFCTDTFFCDKLCSFRRPMTYLAVVDQATGHTLSTHMLDNAPNLGHNQVLVEMTHPGCPKYN